MGAYYDPGESDRTEDALLLRGKTQVTFGDRHHIADAERFEEDGGQDRAGHGNKQVVEEAEFWVGIEKICYFLMLILKRTLTY